VYRSELQSKLDEVAAEADKAQKRVLSGWRWLEADGKLTKIVKGNVAA
jgi:hypothetical protein